MKVFCSEPGFDGNQEMSTTNVHGIHAVQIADNDIV